MPQICSPPRFGLITGIFLCWSSLAHGAVYMSIKASQANMRIGPGLEYPIRLQLQTPNAPVRLLDRYGDWRKLADMHGNTGWMHHSLISTKRTVGIQPGSELVAAAPAGTMPAIRLYAAPRHESRVRAFLTVGLVGALEKCTDSWCRIRGLGSAKSYDGWVLRIYLWGLDEAD